MRGSPALLSAASLLSKLRAPARLSTKVKFALTETTACYSGKGVYMSNRIGCDEALTRSSMSKGQARAVQQRQESISLDQSLDQPQARHCSEGRKHDEVHSMYKLRNGKGEALSTPKRSSISRAKELLTTPPSAVRPLQLTVTGADWPVATVV